MIFQWKSSSLEVSSVVCLKIPKTIVTVESEALVKEPRLARYRLSSQSLYYAVPVDR